MNLIQLPTTRSQQQQQQICLCSGNLHADLQNWILEWPAFKAHAQGLKPGLKLATNSAQLWYFGSTLVAVSSCETKTTHKKLTVGICNSLRAAAKGKCQECKSIELSILFSPELWLRGLYFHRQRNGRSCGCCPGLACPCCCQAI